MYDFCLSNKDIKILKEVIDLSKRIGKCYEILIEEERLNQKENGVYIEILEQIKKYKSQEELLYKKLELDAERVMFIKSYLSTLSVIHCKNLNIKFSAACNNSISELWLHRVNDKLSFYSEDSVTLATYLKLSNEDIPEDKLDQFKELVIEEELNNEFFKAFTYFLEEKIENCEDTLMKDYLINVKYNLFFTHTPLEEETIKDNFKRKDFLSFSFNIYGNLMNFHNDRTDGIVEDCSYDYCSYATDNILQMIDFEYHDTKHLQEIYSIYFRAGLSLSYNSKTFNNHLLALIERIGDDKTQDPTTDIILDKLIYRYLNSSINGNSLDKGKCKYLSLFKPE